jgi:branched-chain amino acid transport system substrate-binding protein
MRVKRGSVFHAARSMLLGAALTLAAGAASAEDTIKIGILLIDSGPF